LVAEDPLTCVVRGCGIALERMDRLGSIFYQRVRRSRLRLHRSHPVFHCMTDCVRFNALCARIRGAAGVLTGLTTTMCHAARNP